MRIIIYIYIKKSNFEVTTYSVVILSDFLQVQSTKTNQQYGRKMEFLSYHIKHYEKIFTIDVIKAYLYFQPSSPSFLSFSHNKMYKNT